LFLAELARVSHVRGRRLLRPAKRHDVPHTRAAQSATNVRADVHTHARARKGRHVESSQVTALREAIENLINAKLQDVLSRPNGLQRLIANRQSGVASPDIRDAEKRLEQALGEFSEGLARPLQEMDA